MTQDKRKKTKMQGRLPVFLLFSLAFSTNSCGRFLGGIGCDFMKFIEIYWDLLWDGIGLVWRVLFFFSWRRRKFCFCLPFLHWSYFNCIGVKCDVWCVTFSLLLLEKKKKMSRKKMSRCGILTQWCTAIEYLFRIQTAIVNLNATGRLISNTCEIKAPPNTTNWKNSGNLRNFNRTTSNRSCSHSPLGRLVEQPWGKIRGK